MLTPEKDPGGHYNEVVQPGSEMSRALREQCQGFKGKLIPPNLRGLSPSKGPDGQDVEPVYRNLFE